MIKIKCDCGFEEIPENFNATQNFCDNHGGVAMRMINISCPICGDTKFFQHFTLSEDEYLKKDNNNATITFTHLIAPKLEEAKTQEEAQEIAMRKLKELKDKYKGNK